MDSHFANFLDFMVQHDKPMDIKEEALDHTFSLLSPPVTPSPPSFTLPSVPSTTSRRRGSASCLAGPKRPRPYPYPSINRDTSSRKEELGIMSNSSAYHGTWNTSVARSGHGRHPHVERRTSNGEEQTAYNIPPFMNEAFPDLRPMSSSSSLTGAMGDANISSHSRHSRSPTSSNSGHVYTGNMQDQGLTWNPPSHMNMTIAMNDSAYPGVPGNGGLSFSGMTQSDLDISLNEYSTDRHGSPSSLSPHSPNYQYGTSSRGHLAPQQGGGAIGYPGSPMATYSSSSEDKNNEVARLQRRIRELEMECSRAKIALQSQSMKVTGLPGAPQSPAFQASWRARTDARKKMFCSLNRAGNALCAWHDSRRERRVYPPRNAPPGYLNCGCSYEEALFEESLARHGVGSYLPGETVRMDPALRNPLLKLLEKRYGYKDGDFEHDPITETWFEGESPAAWDQKAQSGQVVKRRTDADRH